MFDDGGVCGEAHLRVTDADTAPSLRSGEVWVLGTPRVVALCEEATLNALAGHLSDEDTSVGARVELSHMAPVAVGTDVKAAATLERTEGRRLIFSVSVSDACGLVAAGRITRIVVNKMAFLDRVH